MLRESLRSGARRPILQLPTGAGKTVIAATILRSMLRARKRAVFTVPSLSLIDQTFERFGENGVDPGEIGVIQGNHPWSRPRAPVQIATSQTLGRRTLPIVDYVIVDECHEQHKSVLSWMREAPDTIFIGLTATPWSAGLGRHYDALIKPTSISELIELGRLSPFTVFAPPSAQAELAGVRTVAGDYHEGDLQDALDKPALTADIVRTWQDRAFNQPTLCFATGRRHAKSLVDQFVKNGVRTGYVDKDTPREERGLIGERLARHELQVVVNIGCLTRGVDWDVRALILARPTKSEQLYVQIIGRALRTAKGKDRAIILDHSDTTQRLGLVTDIDRDELCMGVNGAARSKKKERKEAALQPCPTCSALVQSIFVECPSCGCAMPHKAQAVADGELQELRYVRAEPIQRPRRWNQTPLTKGGLPMLGGRHA
jgi:DNA repair protein RadD